ncbi:SRPBCC family protein [Neobacillus sp. CF12]|uniref:SRPBCC family protein n=1 Tax=Neobacillus sp. CF12 TaxID=3055864 RepID=UPI0025A0F305|nr:SRPBCC family protein [Neobacillus sp. CF12]MDM5331045.1 SRPBCC family protein [Neobacillus sp. CF12]
MIARIEIVNNNYLAIYERNLSHPVEEVWSYLTDNEKLPKWFSELRVDELREGGVIKFDMGDGTFDELTILDLKLNSILEFSWWADAVRFELSPESGGSSLRLIEKIHTITEHTPRDLAGWHVCLDVIEALLDDRSIERKEEWKYWYEKYVKEIEKVTQQ